MALNRMEVFSIYRNNYKRLIHCCIIHAIYSTELLLFMFCFQCQTFRSSGIIFWHCFKTQLFLIKVTKKPKKNSLLVSLNITCVLLQLCLNRLVKDFLDTYFLLFCLLVTITNQENICHVVRFILLSYLYVLDFWQ